MAKTSRLKTPITWILIVLVEVTERSETKKLGSREHAVQHWRIWWYSSHQRAFVE